MGVRRMVEWVSTRSRPKAAETYSRKHPKQSWFQHAAARRRLSYMDEETSKRFLVSTRSRPKAAEAARKRQAA